MADSNGGSGAAGAGLALGAAAGQVDRRSSAIVNFKDLNLSLDDELSECDSASLEALSVELDAPGDADPTNKTAIIRRARSGGRGAAAAAPAAAAQRSKLIIVMVGLPGRGKTFLCNKLKCYLNWCGSCDATPTHTHTPC